VRCVALVPVDARLSTLYGPNKYMVFTSTIISSCIP
jgi:hypothetical protein